MYALLLKKALPFALTFIFGAALSALVGLFWSSETGREVVRFQYQVGEHGRGRRECGMRRHNLVAETKPLNILDVPDAVWPRDIQGDGAASIVPVKVTFGADGTVRKVEVSDRYTRNDLELPPRPLWDAVVTAAKQIQFTPETVNSVPVTVEREVEIRFLDE